MTRQPSMITSPRREIDRQLLNALNELHRLPRERLTKLLDSTIRRAAIHLYSALDESIQARRLLAPRTRTTRTRHEHFSRQAKVYLTQLIETLGVTAWPAIRLAVRAEMRVLHQCYPDGLVALRSAPAARRDKTKLETTTNLIPCA